MTNQNEVAKSQSSWHRLAVRAGGFHLANQRSYLLNQIMFEVNSDEIGGTDLGNTTTIMNHNKWNSNGGSDTGKTQWLG